MISIAIDKPDKLKPTPFSPLSGFVSFNYDVELVAYMRRLPSRAYIPESKEWEIPLTSIPQLVNDFPQHDVQIIGEMTFERKTQAKLPEGFEFKTKPFSHQLEGVLYGLDNDTFLLGDDQGLGKSKQAIDLAVIRKKYYGVKHCLIICGVNSLKYNWKEEVSVHSNEKAWVLGTRYTKRHPIREVEGSSKDKLEDLNNLPDDYYFIITNVETLRQLSQIKPGTKKKKIFPIAEKIQELCDSGEIGMIIFDECHKCKDPTSQQGSALLNISAKYMMAMSGTPLMNNPLDLYFPLYWLGYENHSFYQYKRHYCVLGGYGGSEVVGYRNLGELRSVVDRVMLRRTKNEVLDLPPKIRSYEYVDMYPEQKKIYEEVKSALREEINKLKLSNNPLAQMIRLRQATGYPGILSSKITESAKMDRMVELVEEITSSGQKAIIFSNWEQITSVAKQKLIKYNPAYITGDTDSTERMNEVSRFQNDPKCKVIIGTIGAMGTGLTLTAASYVIFLDSPWNRALKDQAEDRAHRIGTKGTVNIITICCRDTIDERIEDIVYKKGKMADMLIDGKTDVAKQSAYVDLLLS